MKCRSLPVALLALVVSGCTPFGGGAKPSKPRLVRCHHTKAKITIDGRLDEPAWEDAVRIEDFRVPVTGARAKHPTSARLLWSDDFLYLAVVMEDLDIYGLKKERDSWTWEDDVVELFLKPSDVEPAYFEIHVTPLGTILDLLIARRGAAGNIDRWKDWDSQIKAAVSISGTLNNWKDQDKGWVVEAAIPLSAFTPTAHKPQLGDRWRFAVSRYDYSVYLPEGKELSCSAPLTVLDFHHYEDFDLLDFAE